jgi:predicted Zn-dependent protease
MIAERNREEGEHSDAQKKASAQLGLIGRQKRVFHARARRESRHESGHIFG